MSKLSQLSAQNGKKAKAKTYTIHRGPVNEKVKGYFHETFDHSTGKKWLVGQKVTGTYQERGEQLETTEACRVEITGCKYTVRG